MPKIYSVEGMENKGNYANVFVTLDNGEEAVIYIGGACEVFFDEKFNKVKAFIKKRK